MSRRIGIFRPARGAELDAAYQARRRAEEVLDPFGGVAPECASLYEQLAAGLRARSG